ncbi:MAG: M20/M25/M40 family metallo-hydrolase [Coriobacteriia bacterium]|nr:M20/M25/M40 family metallo-hydrolase [Coriobacteriia bacterium]
MKLLETLSNADAISGCEQEVRDIMKKHMKADNMFFDNLGGIVFEKKGRGPKILIAAHMDEVGFIVKKIKKNGRVIAKAMGGVMADSKKMREVRITTEDGKKIAGILNTNDKEKTYIDLGLDSKQEVEKLGIEPGNMVTFTTSFQHMNNNVYCGKAFDNRIGVYILAKVLENVKNLKLKNTTYFAGTVAEEVGTRGAQTIAHKVKPDVAFVVDTISKLEEDDTERELRKGMCLTLTDKRTEPNRYLVKLIKKTAKKLNKNIQLDIVEKGATDASQIHRSGDGVPSVSCSVPLRFVHHAYSIVDKQDIDDTIEIFTEIISNFDKKTYNKCVEF